MADTPMSPDPLDPAAPTVLVADDDPDLLALCVAVLGGAGYQVTAGRDGDDALAALVDRPVPDVLVTDIVMPGRDGFALAEAVLGEHPDVAVVFATGHPTDEVRERAAALGRELLVKPYTPAQLLAAVATALDRSGRS